MKTPNRLMAASLLAMSFALPAQAIDIPEYTPVTAERLANPEPGNWLTHRRTYDGQGHSPLDQITTENVSGL
jgi:alcohol dehydrogenase (cytochrome c)